MENNTISNMKQICIDVKAILDESHTKRPANSLIENYKSFFNYADFVNGGPLVLSGVGRRRLIDNHIIKE